MRYQVILPRSVQKELDRLSDDIANRILARLTQLETNPRPADVKKLKGRSAWRIRIGDYRVIYEIHDRVLQIVIITIGHRREIYR
ncbi:MAG TPA: type II toxin-antitoxin system RelE/ParE family toxin [Verrucomicrobiae bacterium]|jgi:mRNA interferase RelE/StbE|nr:type II toxin-antitoxin system RelE/ParE family toxin [Verrucomicrobiae bacterium]